MATSTEKKLSLNKETLRQLGDDELQQVVGGTIDFNMLLAANEWLYEYLFNQGANAAAANGRCSTIVRTTSD